MGGLGVEWYQAPQKRFPRDWAKERKKKPVKFSEEKEEASAAISGKK